MIDGPSAPSSEAELTLKAERMPIDLAHLNPTITTIFALTLACAMDQPDAPADAGSTSAMDLSAFERFATDELPDALVKLSPTDAEPVALSDLLGDDEVLFVHRDQVDAGEFVPNAPQVSAPQDANSGEFEDSDPEPVGACACSFVRRYSVLTGTYQVVTCVPAAGSDEPDGPFDPTDQVEMYCYNQTIYTYAEIECSNACEACGTEACLDDRGRQVERPDVEPFDTQWTPCNLHNRCLGGEGDGGGPIDPWDDPAPL